LREGRERAPQDGGHRKSIFGGDMHRNKARFMKIDRKARGGGELLKDLLEIADRGHVSTAKN
jgi:hypothetical protein